jgi:hypothetical protein
MATSIFERVADALEQRTDLSQLEARGTVRLALKQAGLEARDVTGAQMAVVVDQVLPPELRSRGVERGEDICREIGSSLQRSVEPRDDQKPGEESPEAVFRRLARG